MIDISISVQSYFIQPPVVLYQLFWIWSTCMLQFKVSKLKKLRFYNKHALQYRV